MKKGILLKKIIAFIIFVVMFLISSNGIPLYGMRPHQPGRTPFGTQPRIPLQGYIPAWQQFFPPHRQEHSSSGPSQQQERLIDLPQEILDILAPQASLQHVESFAQWGMDTCGVFSLFNAAAIAGLTQRNVTITTETIQQYIVERGWDRKVEKLQQAGGLACADLVVLAQEIGFTDVYFVDASKAATTFSFTWAGVVRGKPTAQALEQEDFRRIAPPTTAFIINTGGHWVLLCVVNKPGKPLAFYYLDSINTPLFAGSNQFTALQLLYAMITAS